MTDMHANTRNATSSSTPPSSVPPFSGPEASLAEAASMHLNLASSLWPNLDEMSEIVDAFYLSPFGTGWDSYETSDLLDHIAWFAGTHGNCQIFEWNVERAELFLENILDQIELADPTRASMFPALLRGWVRFVGSREKLPALETRRTLAAIEHAEPIFFTRLAPAFADYVAHGV